MSKIQSFIFKHSIFIGTIKTRVMNIDVQQEQSQGLSMMNKNEKDTALLYLQETMVNKTKMLVHIYIYG